MSDVTVVLWINVGIFVIGCWAILAVAIKTTIDLVRTIRKQQPVPEPEKKSSKVATM